MEVKMSLQEIYYVAEMVVGVAVIASIVFVAIELRQNSYMLKKSMSDQRQARMNWFTESVIMDSDLRHFHWRLSNYHEFDDDQKHRALFLSIKALVPSLNELIAYFEGQLSVFEFENLKWPPSG